MLFYCQGRRYAGIHAIKRFVLQPPNSACEVPDQLFGPITLDGSDQVLYPVYVRFSFFEPFGAVLRKYETLKP
jgi:hypothetical protein